MCACRNISLIIMLFSHSSPLRILRSVCYAKQVPRLYIATLHWTILPQGKRTGAFEYLRFVLSAARTLWVSCCGSLLWRVKRQRIVRSASITSLQLGLLKRQRGHWGQLIVGRGMSQGCGKQDHKTSNAKLKALNWAKICPKIQAEVESIKLESKELTQVIDKGV